MSARTARVVTVSTRAAAGSYADHSGPAAVAALRGMGYAVEGPLVVPDGDAVETELRSAVAAGVDLVVTSGGTGISPTDRTPEMTSRVIDRQISGMAEAMRTAAIATVPTAMLSRAVAGVAGQSLIVNLPGSPGGVRDGLAVLAPVLEHALAQIRGEDGHAPPAVGPGVVTCVAVTVDELSVDAHARLVDRPSAGAVVTFSGVVRDHDGGRTVLRLEYDAHPSAADVLAEVAADIAKRPAAQAIAVSHRVGALEVGDVALACAVSSSHRGEAFALCQLLVDEVKRRLPVWKLQVFADGTQEWVGSP